MTIYDKPKFSEVFGARGQHTTPKTAEHYTKNASVWKFLQETRGEAGANHIAEAITTSDFDYILTTNMNAQLIDLYSYDVPSYTKWTRGISVPDFKANPLPYLNDISGLMDEITETTESTYGNMTDGQYSITAAPFEKKIKLTRKDIVNDALNAFRSIPRSFSRMAARTIEYKATQKIADVDGPDATLFTGGNANLITSELSYTALEEAWKKMAAQTNPNGDPIFSSPKGIIVPKQLEPVARRIVSAMEIETISEDGSGVGFRSKSDNMFKGLEIAVAPYITTVSTSNTYAAKQWYMYADPAQSPTVAVATLQGNPDPKIYSKAPDAVVVGGGSVPYSFQNNTLEWKVGWDLGFAQIDYRGMVASKPAS